MKPALWAPSVRRRDDGAVAVEFALIAPLLLLLVFGLIQYGFYFWSMQGGSSAAREAARKAAVGEPVACEAFRAYVKDRIGVTGDTDSAEITRTYTDEAGDEIEPDDVEVGHVVTVSVTFNSYDMNIPFVPFIDDGVVSQTADSRVEFVPDEPQVCDESVL